MRRKMLLVFALGLGVVLLVLGVHTLQSRSLARLDGALRGLADRHGWTLAENEDRTLWRLRGTAHGHAWVADARRPSPNDGRLSAQRTRLTVTRPGGGVYVGPKLPEGPAGVAARAAVGGFLPEAQPLLDGATPVPIPGPLGVSHEGRAVSDAAWQSVPPGLLTAFEDLSRRHRVALSWRDDQLTVATGQCLTDAAEIERFLADALALAR